MRSLILDMRVLFPLRVPFTWPYSPHPTKRHPPYPSLHAIPRLQNPSIRGQKHALSRMRQTLNITALSRPRNLPQVLARQPYPPRRLTYQLHILKHRLVIPVLHPDPQSPPRRVLRDMDLVPFLIFKRIGMRTGIRFPGPLLQYRRHLLQICGVRLRLQEEGLGRRGGAQRHGRDEAFALQAQHEVHMQLRDGYGGQAQPCL